MTEIPEHLLERSRARRAALGLGGGESPEQAKPAEGEAGEQGPEAEAASAVPAKAAAAPARKAVAAAPRRPEVELSPYARAGLARKKIPLWAVPVLLFLPMWAFLYWGTLEPPEEEVAGLFALGQEIYMGRCAACHAADGTGAGAIVGVDENDLVFPAWERHAWWVINGSGAVSPGTPYGSPEVGRTSEGGMPSWGDSLSARELLSVVYYERVRFTDETEADLGSLEALAESPELPAQLATGTSLEELETLVGELAGDL